VSEGYTHLALGVVQAILIGLLAWAGRTFHERMLDASEVKVLREWAGRLHEIGELSASIEKLNRTLHEEALDRGELRRVRSFFFGTTSRSAELHDLKGEVATARLQRERNEMRITAIETERRESNRRLDKRLEEIMGQISDQAHTMTEILKRLPTAGLRGTPPEGNLVGGSE